MHICLVYDCLFPWTIGGGERWYRDLAERLVSEGHQVTYLTLRQWDEAPRIDGVSVIDVGPRMALYHGGKRRLIPPLRFGLGVLLHLLRHGRSYDVVHTASFPYFSLLAAAMARFTGRYRINCDWLEVWSSEYWADYLGPLGRMGEVVQALCARVPQKAYTFSLLHKERLEGLGVKSVTRLTGLCPPKAQAVRAPKAGTPPTIVYAGRFIPEKRVELLVDAIAVAREQSPNLRALLIGDGPTRASILARIQALGLEDVVTCPGFVSSDALDTAMASAVCVVQPSQREGYGIVVVEAAHRGVPTIVVEGPDNAATELVANGQNGFVVESPEPELLGEAILECARRGTELRERTRQWYADHEERLSVEASLAVVIGDYDNATPSSSAITLDRPACVS